MKKYMLTAVVLLIAWVEVSAQVYDTIHRRSPNYYYTEWCDEDSVFYVPYPPYRPGTTFTIRMCFYDVAGVGNLYQGIDHYTPRPLEVKGLSCMVAQQYITGCHTDRYFYERDTGNFPEHMYIYQRDSVTDSLVMLDSVRWDTAAPKILELPRNYDTSSGSEYCYVYEAMLDKPVTVNGRFFIASSNRNWTCRDVSPFPIYKPFIQVSIAYENRPTPQYHTLYRNYDTAHGQFDNNFLNDNRWYHYGPYFAIVEKTWQLGAESADTNMGFATGAGYFIDSSTCQIRALPKAGYKFTHWNDGDTSNPRQVVVTQDTLFAATFKILHSLGIEDAAGGLALSIAPNPADGSVVVTCGDGVEEGSVAVRDVLGKVLRRGQMRGGVCRMDLSDLPGGIYYLTLTSPQGSATRKLLVR